MTKHIFILILLLFSFNHLNTFAIEGNQNFNLSFNYSNFQNDDLSHPIDDILNLDLNDDDSSNQTAQISIVCGNFNIEAGEQCDDGNRISGDGCSPQCQLELDFQLLFRVGIAQSVFNVDFNDDEYLDLVESRRTVVLGLTKLISLPLPPEIQNDPISLESATLRFVADGCEGILQTTIPFNVDPITAPLSFFEGTGVEWVVDFFSISVDSYEGIDCCAGNGCSENSVKGTLSAQIFNSKDPNSENNFIEGKVEFHKIEILNVGTINLDQCMVDTVNFPDSARGCYERPVDVSVTFDIFRDSQDFMLKAFPVKRGNGVLRSFINDPYFGSPNNIEILQFGNTRFTRGLYDDILELAKYQHLPENDYIVAFVSEDYFPRNLPDNPNALGFNFLKNFVQQNQPNISKVALVEANPTMTNAGILAHELTHGLTGLGHSNAVSSGYDTTLLVPAPVENKVNILNATFGGSPSSTFWPTEQEYSLLFKTLTTPNLDPTILVITGLIDKSGSVNDISYTIFEEGFETLSAEEGTYTLIAKDDDDILQNIIFEPSFKAVIEPEEDIIEVDFMPFSIAIPFNPEIKTIQFLKDDVLMTEIEANPAGLALLDVIERLPLQAFKIFNIFPGRFGEFIATIQKEVMISKAIKVEDRLTNGSQRSILRSLRSLERISRRILSNKFVPNTLNETSKNDVLSITSLLKNSM